MYIPRLTLRDLPMYPSGYLPVRPPCERPCMPRPSKRPLGMRESGAVGVLLPWPSIYLDEHGNLLCGSTMRWVSGTFAVELRQRAGGRTSRMVAGYLPGPSARSLVGERRKDRAMCLGGYSEVVTPPKAITQSTRTPKVYSSLRV